MMKVFISQPMKDRSDEDIKAERNAVIEALKKDNENVEVIDSFFEGAPHDAKPLWFLAKSLELLSTADKAVFVDYCNETSRGCKIEALCCKEYGIDSCSFLTDTSLFSASSC